MIAPKSPTGPMWFLRHPNCPDAVCPLTGDEYSKAPKPSGSIGERVFLVTYEEFRLIALGRRDKFP
jgi:hypothetical protein